MPPALLFDIESIDLTRAALTKPQIYDLLLHRHEFQLLERVCSYDLASPRIVACAEITADDWWVRAHVEGKPLLPGVLMLEMAAQTSAVLARLAGNDAFMGFGGVDRCKFREMIVPSTSLYLLCIGVDHRPRRIVSDVQGVVEGRVVFEARITGLTIR